MANCNCCGCNFEDGNTSVVTGSGSSSDPFKVEVLDPLFSTQRYAVRRQRSTNQVITGSALTDVDFTTASAGGSFDRGGFFSAPSTFTIPTQGIYIFGATVAFELGGGSGNLHLEVFKNGSTIIAQNDVQIPTSPASSIFVSVSSSDQFNAADTLVVRTTSNGLDLIFDGEQSPVFWAIYMGRFV